MSESGWHTMWAAFAHFLNELALGDKFKQLHRGKVMKKYLVGIGLLTMLAATNVSADSISGDLQLRDAIYLYNQEFRANALKSIVGQDCDVFQLVLDVESGYADIAYAQSSSLSNALSSQTIYKDRIFDWQAMFAYALYQGQATKTFSFGDRNYTGTGFKTGQGTVFGYCYSTKPGARVYINERDLCTNKFSDGHTEAMASCTPLTYGTNTNPTSFTADWLNGKTAYAVNWDNGVPTISRLAFNNGTVTFTGILNDPSPPESEGYSVDANGALSFATEPGFSAKIVCGGNAQYFRVHSYQNGVFENASLLFYNQTDAQNYAALMTGDVRPCYAPQ
jgi:hypothetical protein